jgi:hypothetical protein
MIIFAGLNMPAFYHLMPARPIADADIWSDCAGMKPLLLLLLVASSDPDTSGPITTRRDLKAPQEFQGYPCAPGYAWFFTDGNLESCSLSREIAFGEITAPEKSWITLSPQRAPRFVWLPQDAMVRGYLCRGGAVEHSYSIALYPDGKIKTIWLAADTVVGGIPCMRAGFTADAFGGGVETDLHENGSLQRCKVARDLTVQGQVFHRGDHIRLDGKGKLASRP